MENQNPNPSPNENEPNPLKIDFAHYELSEGEVQMLMRRLLKTIKSDFPEGDGERTIIAGNKINEVFGTLDGLQTSEGIRACLSIVLLNLHILYTNCQSVDEMMIDQVNDVLKNIENANKN